MGLGQRACGRNRHLARLDIRKDGHYQSAMEMLSGKLPAAPESRFTALTTPDGLEQTARSPGQRPVAVQYCATFLRPEMLHISRQITSLQNWRPVVLCQKREEAARFPFDPSSLVVFKKPATHGLRRIWVRQILRRPVMIYRSEARRIAAEIERSGGRLLHIYFGNIAVHLLPFLRRAQVPVIVSFHGADAGVDMDRPAYRKPVQEMLGLAKLVLVRSKALAKRVETLGCPPEKIRINRTGIPLDGFRFRQRTAPEDGAWRFFQACRLIPKKGLLTSLRAFAKFSKKHPRSTFVIAGEGPMIEELWVLAGQLGISEQVHFAGFLAHDALLELLSTAHAFLHPSETGPDGNQEGVPNSLLEAMSTGLPILATRHGGIPEAVTDGESGLLVHERDSDGLAAAMDKLASDPSLYRSLSVGAARAVAVGFEQKQQIESLERCYAEAAGLGNLLTKP